MRFAVLYSDLWRWTFKHRQAIQQASESYHAVKMMVKDGNIPMLVWHDESDSFECAGSIPGISVINSLSKDYPITGKYEGGMVLRLYVGIGVGIAFTKTQVKKMIGKNNHFANATRMYESPSTSLSTSQLPPKQRREAKAAKTSKLMNKKKERQEQRLMMESHNIAKLARIEGTKKLKEANKHHSCKRRKFTFNEAAAYLKDDKTVRGVRNEHIIYSLPQQHTKYTLHYKLEYNRPCVCGSLTHVRTTHVDCLLNKRYEDA